MKSLRLLIALVCCAAMLPGCSSKQQVVQRPIDRPFTQYMASAKSSLVDYGNADQAASLYAQALDRAYTVNNPDLIAQASYGRAAALARLRMYDQALAALAVPGVELPAARLPQRQLLAARIHLELGQPMQAVIALDGPVPAGTSGALWQLSLAEAALQQGDLARATSLSEQAIAVDAPAYRQYTARFEGLRARAAGEHAAAARSFAQEADHARNANNWPAAAEATARAAEAYALSGDPAKAAALYLQAGRSAKLQPQAVLPADDWLTAAAEHAQPLGLTDIVQAARELMDQP